jgi:hypothetical protein
MCDARRGAQLQTRKAIGNLTCSMKKRDAARAVDHGTLAAGCCKNRSRTAEHPKLSHCIPGSSRIDPPNLAAAPCDRLHQQPRPTGCGRCASARWLQRPPSAPRGSICGVCHSRGVGCSGWPSCSRCPWPAQRGVNRALLTAFAVPEDSVSPLPEEKELSPLFFLQQAHPGLGRATAGGGASRYHSICMWMR